jgi:hypothetical protein
MKQPEAIAPIIETYENTQSLNTFADEMKELINPTEDSSSEEEMKTTTTEQV